MVGQVLSLSALVALTQAKAIVTNQCTQPVYVWSVPSRDGVAENLPIAPNKRYEEPWRLGTSISPGIAIKVSPWENGINEGKDELEFQYTADTSDSSKVWINLNIVSSQMKLDYVFHSCGNHTYSNQISAGTHLCAHTDDVELVLCGSNRTIASEDKTPMDAIKECINRERGAAASIHPHQCNGRIIGPKPRHEPRDRDSSSEDDSINHNLSSDDEKPTILAPLDDHHGSKHALTFPLKAVMRHEAAKHVAPRDTQVAGKEPVCDFIRSAEPGLSCDEAESQLGLRELYMDNCGEKSKRIVEAIFPIDCQKVRKSIKTMWPDVDREVEATKTPSPRDTPLTRRAPPDTPAPIRMCIKRAYARLGSLYRGDMRLIRDHMNTLFEDRVWTSDEEVCSRPIDRSNLIHERKRCVKRHCKPWVQHADCSDVEDALEELSKDAGRKIDWTTDDEACDHDWDWKRESNATHLKRGPHLTMCNTKAMRLLEPLVGRDQSRMVLDGLFYDRAWTSDENVCQSRNATVRARGRKTRRCVLPYCEPAISYAECSDVEDALETISRDAGHKIDWTSSDDECGGYLGRREKQGLV